MTCIHYAGKLKFCSKHGNLFQIDRCKEIKKERLECHLYGKLISILLCSSTMFKMRQLLLDKKKKELSEYKSIYMIKIIINCFMRDYKRASMNY